jgi:hypothetical protein
MTMTTETIAPQAPQNGVPRAAEEMQVEVGITLAENELSARHKSESVKYLRFNRGTRQQPESPTVCQSPKLFPLAYGLCGS